MTRTNTKLAALGTALGLAALAPSAMAADVYVYSLQDRDAMSLPDNSVVLLTEDATVQPVYVVEGSYVSTPSSTGQRIGDGLFNRSGPNDFGQ